MCERCQDPSKTAHEYKTDAGYPHGKVTLCDECAEIHRQSGFKLTGGKREAEPEASTEADESKEEEAQQAPQHYEPAARPSRRRG